MTIRVLIVDDEPIAREGIRTALQAGYEVVAECGNGLEAVIAIRELSPDLVFLDIQMPELDGFGVVREIGPDRMPVVVFVTAYDSFALKAFDVSAVDYLLKPFDEHRFEQALKRAALLLDRRTMRDMTRQLESLTRAIGSRQKPLDRLVVRSGGRIFFVGTDEIHWLRSADNYVELHLEKETHLIRDTLASLEAKLDPTRFVRVRASTMVNAQRVKELRPGFNGEYTLLMESGEALTSSRRYRAQIAALLGE